MARWLPRTLFARMVLVLLAGLAVAQLISLAVLWRERGEFMLRAAGMYSAERVAGIITLLEATPAAERARVVAVVTSPPLRVALAPAAAAPAGDPALAAEAAQYAALLEAALGGAFPLKVGAVEARRRGPAGGGPGYGAMHGYGPGAGGGRPAPMLAFVVETRLTDGTPVTFDARQPHEAVDWPVRLLASLGVLLVAVCAVTLFAVRWVTRPLKTLAAAAEELGDDIHRPPLDEGGPLEVRRAARAFNAMQAKLAALISDRTRIFSAMSHDLKTPITRLRLRSELLDDPLLRDKFAADLREMEAMVGAALDFMRGVERREPLQPVDVMALIESVAADAREVGGAVELAGAASAPLAAHAPSLKRCLMNLVDNAVKYGGVARLLVADDAQQLRVTVSDDGPGIAPAELARVFEPFYRVEGSRNRATGGSGLGLTIARNVARMHGGDLVLANRDGGGLDAVLTLPRRRRPA